MYGTTTYTSALQGIVKTFSITPRLASFGFTIPFFGVFFAPIYTPHLSERYGRRPIYLTSLPLFSLFVIIGGLATTFPQILVARFFAGLTGGPCLVLIEGTFADIWMASRTVTYYSFLSLALYCGAGLGPVIGGYVLTGLGPGALSWVALLFATFSLALAGSMPETYGREILRRRGKARNPNFMLPPALSGVTLKEMATHTVINPVRMMVSEPLVIAISLVLALNFAVVFTWFVTVPVVLQTAYNWEQPKIGLAFLSAVLGAIAAVVSSVAADAIPVKRDSAGMRSIEARLYPAMLGVILVAGSLFWVGFTARPDVPALVPILGTAVYVWGNMSIIISFISYLFDAYPPTGTLSALTATACFRILSAGILSIFILDMFNAVTGKWALSIFGFISLGMLPVPFAIFFLGETLRRKSRFSDRHAMSWMTLQQEQMGDSEDTSLIG
ncbi:hypothetical protein SLS60_009662 [Paraconiothyrium brasiliense]|uniref:Major facilitator superfamily (MFS) profile domain-containing protein n=1 Tax=Paraconiothyrium brasiliense TaxID=300254 RepID=A0ABR3QUX8_9PLEO